MITVRRMEAGDAKAAARLEAESFSAPWSERAFAETLQCGYAYYYVAETEAGKPDGQVVGICGLRNIAGEGEITNVAVGKHFRRMGVAGMLLEKVLAAGEGLGIRDFTLEVRSGNEPAVSLYEKYGFRVEGVRRNFYEKPREDALIMWRRQSRSGCGADTG